MYISDSAAYYFSNRFRYYQYYGLPVLLVTIECSSAELQLSQCNYTRYSGIHTYWRRQFGVRCQIARESKNQR